MRVCADMCVGCVCGSMCVCVCVSVCVMCKDGFGSDIMDPCTTVLQCTSSTKDYGNINFSSSESTASHPISILITTATLR